MAQDRTYREERPRRRHRRGPGIMGVIAYVLFIIGISAFLATVGWNCAKDVLGLGKAEASATVEIGKEDSLDDVAQLLKDNGIIENRGLFKLFAKVTHGEKKITWGVYTVTSDMDYRALITNLSSNSTTRQTVKVTIPEGYTVDQIFTLLENENVAAKADLEDMAATHDYAFSFLKDIPLGDYHRLEGYLFPDTYEFYINQAPLYVINKMLVNFDAKVTEDMRRQAEDSGYTLREIITIASMVEKETDGGDQKKIASVIYNRLKNPSAGTLGKLQIDATIQYALELKTGQRKEQLTEADLQIDSPYNTYTNAGLTPGPIANPGLDAIQAALDPASTKFYYYVLGDDNVHHFFESYNSFVNYKNSLKG